MDLSQNFFGLLPEISTYGMTERLFATLHKHKVLLFSLGYLTTRGAITIILFCNALAGEGDQEAEWGAPILHN